MTRAAAVRAAAANKARQPARHQRLRPNDAPRHQFVTGDFDHDLVGSVASDSQRVTVAVEVVVEIAVEVVIEIGA